VAIRDLIGRGRLQATGCMTLASHWVAEAALLKPLEGKAQFGVHLTLTDHRPLTAMPRLAPQGRFPGISALIKASWLRRLDAREVAAELEGQLDAFEREMGRPPDFLDGHHHIHQLPVVRDVVLDLWERRLKPQGGWVRSCWDNPWAIWARGIDPVRAQIIAALGLRLRITMALKGVPHNRAFRGVYAFRPQDDYPALFDRFVTDGAPGTLVMCHPGLVDEALAAVEWMTAPREAEYRFLASEDCARTLERHGTRLVPLP
jgi:predicted glycoside hydrolase/deacetylase ChbG (UPF0249 family)